MSPVVSSVRRGAWPARMPSEPSTPGTRTICTSSENSLRSGVTSSSGNVAILLSITKSAPLLTKERGLRGEVLRGHRLGLLDRFVNVADEEEGLLRQVVVLAIDHFLEGADGVLERDVLAGNTGELLRDAERLRKEPLDAAGTRHDQLIFVRKLVDAEDRDDVLQLFIAVQDLLHGARNLVVLRTDDVGLEDLRGGGQRVDRRVDAFLGDAPLQIDVGVQVRESRGGAGSVGSS